MESGPSTATNKWQNYIESLSKHRCDFDILLKDEWRHKIVPRDDKVHSVKHKEISIEGADYVLLNNFLQQQKDISLSSLGLLTFHLVLDAYGYGSTTVVAFLDRNGDDKVNWLKLIPLVVDHEKQSELSCTEALQRMEGLLHDGAAVLDADRILGNGLFDAAFLLGCSPNAQHDAIAKIPLTSIVMENEMKGSLTWKLRYASDLFEEKAVDGILSIAREVMLQMVQSPDLGASRTEVNEEIASPERLVKDLCLLSEAQKQQLDEWNRTDAPYPSDLRLNELFERAVKETPDSKAMVFQDVEMTYEEVNAAAVQIANSLRGLGVSHNEVIALYMDKSDAVVLTMIGIWKAGAAFLPIDPTYPLDRVSFMLNDSGAKRVITSSKYVEKLKGMLYHFSDEIRIVDVDGIMRRKAEVEETCGESIVRADSFGIAYVTYTSGTTGVPKGVPKTHRNVVNSITDLSARYNMLDPGTERVLLFAAYVFEPFVRQMLIGLINSQTLVVLPDDVRRDPERFSDYLREEKITYLNVTGSVLQHLDMSHMAHLKRLLLVGEELTAAGLQQLRKWFNGRIINEYAFTESAFVTAIKEFSPGENTRTDRSIGRPLRNVKCYVLSENLKQVPMGAIGELFIGGMGVASGYLNREDLTKQRFLKNPFQKEQERLLNTNSKIYKTGDLARVLPNGEFEYMGRSDFQLKLNGVRVEPGEIESVAMQFPGIKKCVVIACSRHDGSDSQRYLVGYFTVENGSEVAETELIEYLYGHLIRSMVPARMIQMQTIPVNINGKVDRNALPKIPLLHNRISADDCKQDTSMTSNAIVHPQSSDDAEYILRRIWGDVLGISAEDIDADDNFFRLGGQSISCILLIAKVWKELKKNLDIEDIFKLGTLKSLAEHLQLQTCPEKTEIEEVTENDKEEISLPANGLQQGIFYQSLKMKQTDDTYIMQSVYNYKCQIIPGILKNAWEYVQRKYPSLKIRLKWDSQPLQIISNDFTPLHWHFEDLSSLESDRTRSQRTDQLISTLLDKDRRTPFIMEKGPLFRVYLIKKAEAEFTLIFSCHHIIMDGWSLPILHDDVHRTYTLLVQGSEMTMTKDAAYIAAQRYWANHRLDNLEYWQNKIEQIGERCDLSGLLNAESKYKVNLLNYDHVKEHRERKLHLGVNRTSALKFFCLDCNFTLHSVLQFVWHKVLNAIGGGESSVVGTVVSGRNLPIDGIEKSVGLFISTLPVIVDHERQKEKTIVTAIAELQAEVNAVNRRSIVELGQLKNDEMKHTLFDSILVLENYPKLTEADKEIQCGNEIICFEHNSSNDKIDYPIAVVAHEQDEELVINFWYAGELFDSTMIDVVLDTMLVLFEQLANGFSGEVSQLNLCSQKTLSQFDKWNNTDAIFDSEATLHGMFEQIANKYPDSVAVVYNEVQLSYRELNNKANQLAQYLTKITPLHPNDLVGLVLKKNEQMIIAILAVWKTGAAYVPIDASFPDDRIQFMFEDTKTSLILTNADHRDRISDLSFTFQTVLDVENVLLTSDLCHAPITSVRSTDLAYAIYTSGTTGKPKAVLVEHIGVINLHESLTKLFSLDKDHGNEALLSFSNYVFDHFVEQMTDALLNGQKLVVLNDDMRTDQARLMSYISDNQVTYLSGTPSVLSLYDFSSTTTLTRIDAIGEDFTSAVYNKIRDSFEGVIINGYGPTEVSITTHKRPYGNQEQRMNKSIGSLMQNTKSYVLNEAMKQVPIGGIGELYLGGIGVARGYLNKPMLTSERFLQNPFQDGENVLTWQNPRFYRTGDLARWLPNGEIEYLGRTDQQVKIRGHRIELGEIEAVLTSYPGVSRSFIVVREQIGSQHQTQKHLVGFYCSDREIDEKDLKQWMRSKLSSALVPSHVVRIFDIPVTANGKLDAKRLPDTSSPEGANSTEYTAPVSNTEHRLCEIWSSVLNIPSSTISVHDEFFGLGGDSIRSISLVQLARNAFGQWLSASTVFEFVTIAEQATYIDTHLNSMGNRDSSRNMPLNIKGNFPASLAQQRLLFINEFNGGSAAYNIHLCLKADKFNSEMQNALSNALKSLLTRHSALSTLMKKASTGEWVQTILDEESALSLFDIHTKNVQKRKDIDHVLTMETEHVFELGKELPLRIAIVRCEEELDIAYLSLLFHHACFDWWSWHIFQKELTMLLSSDPSLHNLREIKSTYADYSQWQKQSLCGKRLSELKEFWTKYLAGSDSAVLPQDQRRPAEFDYLGREVEFQIDSYKTASLKALSRIYKVSLYSVLLAAFSLMVETYSAQKDFLIGTPFVNRNQERFQDVIGFFASLLAIRIHVNRPISIKEYIKAVSKAVTEAHSHSEMPFEELIHCLDIENDQSRNPVVQTLFTLLQEDSIQNYPSVKENFEIFKPYKPNAGGWTKTKFDVTVTLTEKNSSLLGNFTYAASIYDEESVQQYLSTFLNILTEFAQLQSYETALLADIHAPSQNQMKMVLQKLSSTGDQTPEVSLPVHWIFEKLSAQKPQAVAVICGNQRITYSELNHRATSMGVALCEAVTLQPDQLVALVLDKNEKIVEAILAVWKSGAAYVPIDPAFPDERIRFMLQETQAKGVVTNSAHVDRLKKLAGPKQPVIGVETLYHSENVLKKEVSSNHLAYAIFTSGTTGRPKAVLVEHRNVHGFLSGINSRFPGFLGNEETILFSSNFVFDFSIEQIALSILSGNSLLISDPELTPYHDAFYKLLNSEKLTYLSGTPTQIHLIDLSRLRHLRTVLVAGELFQSHHFEKIKATFSGELYSAYGTTESTVYNTVECSSETTIHQNTIGKPLTSTKAYVLNEDFQLLPRRAVGELYLTGNCISRGYLSNPVLNREKFIPNPHQGNYEKNASTLYRTGDLVQLTADGNIRYIGRNDNQLKINGIRIEPLEIETILSKYPNIQQCTVLSSKVQESKAMQLVGYIVMENNWTFDERNILDFLREQLVTSMVPSKLVQIMDALPMTINGKIDVNALVKMSVKQNHTSHYTPPRNQLDAKLCALWRAATGSSEIGINDSFFYSGGDSIKAMMLASSIQAELNHRISVKDVFDFPTVHQFADSVLNIWKPPVISCEEDMIDFACEKQPSDSYPLIPIQKWFFSLPLSKPHHWNQTFALKTPELDIPKLQHAIGKILDHHEAFNLRFKKASMSEELQQFCAESNEDWELHVMDIRSKTSREVENELNFWQDSFNIEKGPLWCVAYLYGFEDGSARLWFAMHHLIVDSVSWHILCRDLEIVYHGGSLGGGKESRYLQWANAITNFDPPQEEKELWKTIIKGMCHDQMMSLPSDFTHTHHEHFKISEQETKSLLTDCHNAYGTQINDLLLTAVGVALKKVSKHSTNYITLESHGRPQMKFGFETRDTVGWFTAMFPLPLQVEDDLEQSILKTQQWCNRIPNQGIGYGVLNETKGIKGAPLPVVSFNYLGILSQENHCSNTLSTWVLDPTLCTISKDDSDKSVGPFVVDITMLCTGGQLFATIDCHLVDTRITRVLAQELKDALAQIVRHTLNVKPCTRELPTGVKMCTSLAQNNDMDAYIILNEGTSKHKATLFVFPPGEGGAESYLNNLAKHFNDKVRLVLFNNIHLSSPMESFEALGKYYVDYVKRLQSEGPYHLLGWSFGGVLSLEIALQLQEIGQAISSFFIIDSYFDVYFASQQIGCLQKDDILDPINYYYKPSIKQLQTLAATTSNILLFKAKKMNDVYKDENQRLLFDYYRETSCNGLDRLLPAESIQVMMLQHDTHHSWVRNEPEVVRMARLIYENMNKDTRAQLQPHYTEEQYEQSRLTQAELTKPIAVSFGASMAPLFGIKDTRQQVNSGSNGATPICVMEWAQKLQCRINSEANQFFRLELKPSWKRTAATLAAYVGANPGDLALTCNATFALNSVLRSFLTPTDNVICFSTIYPMVKSILLHTGAQITEVDMDMDKLTSAVIIAQLKNYLEQKVQRFLGPFSLCVVSHITSMPALRFPVEKMIKLCHSYDVKILIDGAQAPGHIPLNLNDLDADFYAGTCHKWMYCCRGSGFLWVKNEHHAIIKPAVIGTDHNYYPSFPDSFIFTGTQDYSSILSVEKGLEYRQSIGEHRIMAYTHSLARSAGEMLAKMWKTEILEVEGTQTAFANVRVPMTDAEDLGFKLMEKGFGFVPTIKINGKWYARFSAQIFNTESDFKAIGEQILKFAHSFILS